VITPVADGDWVSAWEPGPSTVEDVRRRLPHISKSGPASTGGPSAGGSQAE
jgi:hypothetical protein